jgi:sigma-E factor negative regulatory protein RseB
VKPRLPSLLLFLLLLPLASPALADKPSAPERWYRDAKHWLGGLWRKDAEGWLQRIGPALGGLNYQGTIVMVSGTRMETMAVYHANEKGRERLRLVALDGPRREVIRDDKLVMVLGPDRAPVGYDADTAGRWNPAGELAAAEKLDAYEARLGGSVRVAGRDTQVIDLKARDDWRYGYRLWLDRETALPLRVALLDGRGRALEQMAFTDIRIGPAPSAADLRPSTERNLQRIQSLAPGKEADPGWRVADPPRDFELRATRRLGESLQLLYSDGLANVSVYVEPVGMLASGESGMNRGAVNGHSITRHGRRVVAIGKVPAATVERFARQLQPPVERRR